jgi:hypothetical protein
MTLLATRCSPLVDDDTTGPNVATGHDHWPMDLLFIRCIAINPFVNDDTA